MVESLGGQGLERPALKGERERRFIPDGIDVREATKEEMRRFEHGLETPFSNCTSRSPGLEKALLGAFVGTIFGVSVMEGYERLKEPSGDVQAMERQLDEDAEAVRHSEFLEQALTPEQVEAIAGEIESFPVKQVYEALSSKTGMSVEEIAKLNHVSQVGVFTKDSVRSLKERYSDELAMYAADDVESIVHAVGINLERRTVQLNATQLIEMADGGGEKSLRAVTREALMHEFLHGFSHVEFAGADDELRGVFYEGMTEWMANDLLKDVYQERGRDPLAGYYDGGTSAAAFYMETVEDPQRAYQSFVRGEYNALSRAFEEKVGTSLTDIFVVDDEHLAESERYLRIAPLEKMVQATGDEAIVIAQEANRHLDTGRIDVYDDGEAFGVFVTSESAQTGIGNGVLRHGDTSVLFSSTLLDGEEDRMIVNGKHFSVVFADLHRHLLQGQSIDTLPDIDRMDLVYGLAQETSQYLQSKE